MIVHSNNGNTPALEDVFKKEFFFATNVKIERFVEENPRLMGINPERNKAYEPNAGSNKVFSSRENLMGFEQAQREVARFEEPNVYGSVNPKPADQPYSHTGVQGYVATISENSGQHEEMVVRNEYYHNSRANGQSYRGEDGKQVTIKNATASPWDRTNPDLCSARVLSTEKGTSIFYGGRPDTDLRARWQGIDIFMNEMQHGTQKGIVLSKANDKGEIPVTMTYLVNSLTNPMRGQGALGPLTNGLNERDSLIWERQALQKIQENTGKEPIRLERDGQVYLLQLKPIHTHETLSFFGELQKHCPSDDLSGAKLENEINQKGFSNLLKYALENFSNIQEEWKRTLATDIMNKLQHAANGDKSTKISPHQRLAMVDMLARIMNLPTVHHCKSVVDRTSVAAAVAIINQMILEGKFCQVENKGPTDLLKAMEDESYKELFLKALQTQLPVSSDLRTAVKKDGTLNAKRLLPGSNLKDGVMAAHGAIPLFPRRALREITTWEKVKFYFAKVFSFGFLWSPNAFQPKHTFKLDSPALSEGGTRPLIVGAKANKKDPKVEKQIASAIHKATPGLLNKKTQDKHNLSIAIDQIYDLYLDQPPSYNSEQTITQDLGSIPYSPE